VPLKTNDDTSAPAWLVHLDVRKAALHKHGADVLVLELDAAVGAVAQY
jgi:hypothetical protein